MDIDKNIKYKALLITGLGTFLGTLDASIVNVSLPTISRELETTISMVGWVILAYSLAVFSLLLLLGIISEKKGLHFNYLFGFSIFFLGSLLCGLSGGVYFLIIARVIQGIGAAFLMSVGPALVSRSFPDNERGRGLSIIAMTVSVGLMLGPPLGGFIIAAFGWRWIFFINLPVCIVAIFFTLRFFRNLPPANPQKKISVMSSAVIALSLLSAMLSILFYSRGITDTGISLAILILSVTLFGLFLLFERNPSTRLIGLDIFRNRVFVFSGLTLLFVFIGLISVTVLLPFFLEEVKLLRPEQVGLYLMIIPLCAFFVAPLSGYMADKVSARLTSSAGIILIGLGMVLVKYLNETSGSMELIVPLAVIGTGMALFNTPNTSAIMGSVDKKRLGTASSMIATIRTLGISMGVALAVAIFTYFRDFYLNNGQNDIDSFLSAYQSVYKIMIFVLAGALIFSVIRGGKVSSEKPINIQES
jgi:EmrB/QacA subfamily drug resistance transporter